MGLFGGNKNKTKKKSAAEVIGLDVTRVASQEELEAKADNENILKAYTYLRRKVDDSTREFFRTGNSETLAQFVARPALDMLVDHLMTLRNNNMIWEQPNRKTSTAPKLKVLTESIKKTYSSEGKARITEFVVEEQFKDFSVHKRYVNRDGQGSFVVDKEAPGDMKVIQVRVIVRESRHFQIAEVIEIKNAAL